MRTVEYFKYPNLEGATVWEKLIHKGGKQKMRKKYVFKNQKNSNINVKNYKINI